MLYICYDSGYEEINGVSFPNLSNILNNKKLIFNTEDKDGNLINVVKTSKTHKGNQIILTELNLTLIEYITATNEIKAGDNPIIFYKPLNCFIRLCKEIIIIK